jgi:hypothetical protein
MQKCQSWLTASYQTSGGPSLWSPENSSWIARTTRFLWGIVVWKPQRHERLQFGKTYRQGTDKGHIGRNEDLEGSAIRNGIGDLPWFQWEILCGKRTPRKLRPWRKKTAWGNSAPPPPLRPSLPCLRPRCRWWQGAGSVSSTDLLFL